MRFLHTSDWHVGKMLKGLSRAIEHEKVLAEILDIIRREKIDCLLVTGDLFDSHSPPPEAEHLVFNFLAELCGLRIPSVIIGGNHDHPRKLLALRDLLKRLEIHIRPEPVRPSDGGVIELLANAESARIAVLPFVTVGKISDAARLFDPEADRFQEYAERIGAMAERLAESFTSKTINLLLAHLYVDGSLTSGSEREIHVAKPYAVSPQRFPSTAHYIALGHLHRPQEITGPSPCCYAGSPIQLDFGEQGQEKRILLIDAHPGKPATVTSLPLTSGKTLRSIAGTLEELQLKSSDFADDLLRVTVRLEKPAPGIADRIRQFLPNALHITTELPELPQSSIVVTSGADPVELFANFYKQRNASEPPEGVARLFRDLYEEEIHASD
jgi:DNA repair protein SbcD/Mre11